MDKTFFSTNVNRNLGTIVLVAVIIALGAYAKFTWQQAKYSNLGPTTISISGEGEVKAVPDIGQFSFSVVESGADAVVAQAASATKINEIIAYLKEAGVEEKDIKTDYYNLSPKFKYETKPCPFGSYCPQEQVPDGFEVNQTISVKVRDLKQAGTLLTSVGERGATNISSLQFTIDDTDVLKTEARNLAIDNAKEKAEALAKKLNVRLVKMVGYYEDEGNIPYYGYGGAEEKAMNADVARVEPSLPTGENVTKSRVTITYQIR